jgi:hypothetical protein
MRKSGGNLDHSNSPGVAVKVNLFIVYTYGLGEYFVAKTTPTSDVVGNNFNHYAAPLQILPSKRR